MKFYGSLFYFYFFSVVVETTIIAVATIIAVVVAISKISVLILKGGRLLCQKIEDVVAVSDLVMTAVG